MVIWLLPLLVKSKDGATLASFTRFDRRLERGMRTWLVHAALKTAVESKQTRELERVPGLYRGRQHRQPNILTCLTPYKPREERNQGNS